MIAKIVFIFPLFTSIIWMTLATFQTLTFATDLAADLSGLDYFFFVEDVLTMLACHEIIGMSLDVLSYLNITNFLEFLGCHKGSCILHGNWFETISIRTAQDFFIRWIAEGPHVLSYTKPAKLMPAWYEFIRLMQQICTNVTIFFLFFFFFLLL